MTSQQAPPARIGTQVVSAGPLARRTIHNACAAPTHTGVRITATISFSHFKGRDYSKKRPGFETGTKRRTANAGDGRQGGEGQKSREELNTASPDEPFVTDCVAARQGFSSRFEKIPEIHSSEISDNRPHPTGERRLVTLAATNFARFGERLPWRSWPVGNLLS